MGANIDLRSLSNQILSNMDSGHSLEWMVHPGRRSTDYGDDFSRSEEREKEREVVGGEELGEVVEREGFEVVSFDRWLEICGVW